MPLSINTTKLTRYFFLVASGLGLLFAWLAPEVDEQGIVLGLTGNLLLWQVQTLVPIALIIAAHILLLQCRGFDRLNAWMQLLLSGLIGALAFSPLALAIDLIFLSEALPHSIWFELLDEMGGVVPPVLFVWLAMNLPWLLGYKLEKDDKTSQALPKIEQGAAESDDPAAGINLDTMQNLDTFFALIPEAIGRDLIYLKAELHYLSVVTTMGRVLILFSLRDAAELLGSEQGSLCHRSYWIAKHHISEFKQRGRAAELIMSNGDVVPVSQRKMTQIKAWLADSGPQALAP